MFQLKRKQNFFMASEGKSQGTFMKKSLKELENCILCIIDM